MYPSEITGCRCEHQNLEALIPSSSSCKAAYFRVTVTPKHAAFELKEAPNLVAMFRTVNGLWKAGLIAQAAPALY